MKNICIHSINSMTKFILIKTLEMENIDLIKALLDHWLSFIIAVVFVYLVYGAIKKLWWYVPLLIQQHFDELKKMREEHTKETEAFQMTLQAITDKFVSQLREMNDENKVFYKAIEQEHAKHFVKLEEMHWDIKVVKNLVHKTN